MELKPKKIKDEQHLLVKKPLHINTYVKKNGSVVNSFIKEQPQHEHELLQHDHVVAKDDKNIIQGNSLEGKKYLEKYEHDYPHVFIGEMNNENGLSEEQKLNVAKSVMKTNNLSGITPEGLARRMERNDVYIIFDKNKNELMASVGFKKIKKDVRNLLISNAEKENMNDLDSRHLSTDNERSDFIENLKDKTMREFGWASNPCGDKDLFKNLNKHAFEDMSNKGFGKSHVFNIVVTSNDAGLRYSQNGGFKALYEVGSPYRTGKALRVSVLDTKENAIRRNSEITKIDNQEPKTSKDYLRRFQNEHSELSIGNFAQLNDKERENISSHFIDAVHQPRNGENIMMIYNRENGDVLSSFGFHELDNDTKSQLLSDNIENVGDKSYMALLKHNVKNDHVQQIDFNTNKMKDDETHYHLANYGLNLMKRQGYGNGQIVSISNSDDKSEKKLIDRLGFKKIGSLHKKSISVI